MAATSTKRRYDMPVTIRIPEAVRSGVRKLAHDTGDTVTGVILGHIEPFKLYVTEEGQEALRRLEECVARSAAIHKGPPAYHDEKGQASHPPVRAWNGLELRNYGSTEKPLWLHTVRQREGQTRALAVQEYALELWKEWSLLHDSQERRSFLEDVESDAHMFVMGFVNFKTWRRFPSSYEAQLHRKLVTGDGSEPTTAAEVRLFAWCVEWLSEQWEQALEAAPTADVWTLHDTRSKDAAEVYFTEEGFTMSQSLVYYSDCSQEENVTRWARKIMDTCPKTDDYETLKAWARWQRYNVRRVEVDS
jgi:hypothetical protein